MKTTDKKYYEHLTGKYLPGRSIYLSRIFYPKIFKNLNPQNIVVDLGCGAGELLLFSKNKNKQAIGYDSNPLLVELCNNKGFTAYLGDVTIVNIEANKPFDAIIDNVLEHLSNEQLHSFFVNISKQLKANIKLIINVPDKKGFKNDPTHIQFIDKEIIAEMASKYGFDISKSFFHPFNFRPIGYVLYLNMQVFILKKK